MRDIIFHTTTTHLSLWDRLKVLMGKPVIVKSEITCEVLRSAEYIVVIKESAKSHVPSLLK